MATKTLEQYTAEISKTSANARNALENQIKAIEGNLAQTKNQINENYANQQNQLNEQRNQAAESASLRAAGSGGSFGGAGAIAKRKYYEQAFVPAQTQLQTNQSQALQNAQTQADNNRLSLQSQLAALLDQDSRLAWQAYHDAEEAEKNRQAQLKLAKASSASSYFPSGSSASQQQKYGAVADNSGGFSFRNNGTNNIVKYGTAYFGNGGKQNNNTILQDVAGLFGANSNEYNRLSEILKYNSKKNLTNAAGKTYNYGYLSREDSDLLNRLGLKLG